jgi:quercetin dioxygenase-like cupin family protein
MEQPLATPGQIIDAWSTWTDGEVKSVILRTTHMEVLRLHMNAGKRVPTYEAQGEITILCVQGRAMVEACGEVRELNSGQMLYLLINEPFSLFGVEETSLLITVLRPRPAMSAPLIGEGKSTGEA